MIQGVLKAKIQGAAISEIEILETPVGLNEVTNLVLLKTMIMVLVLTVVLLILLV